MLRGRGDLVQGFAALVLAACAGCAVASGPRWVTGPPYFTGAAGQPVIWYTDSPKYFTDPGDLSSTMNHAAADRLVAAAAAVWNIPTSRLTLVQGGVLSEHVSGDNAYPDANGVVFPADVLPGNYLEKQIAVVYDYDGSVTDLLLGAGASDPSGCRQNAVTESVDSIVPAGFIQHAVLVLNGRCTGTAAEKQLQMQYQLMRAFGRVLGLSWSQTNDNVFTNSPTPTPQQALNWPVLHPIDIICGPYTYQCMPQPFTLRMDDICGMALLYFIPQGQAGPGKTDSLANASRIGGRIFFSAEYWHSMQGVNVVGRRLRQYRPDSWVEGWDSVSSVSGSLFRQKSANAVMGEDDSITGSQGTPYGFYEGWYEFARVPIVEGGWQWMVIETEAVNPLYTGAYSVGPYVSNTVQPSGGNLSVKWGIFGGYQTMGWIDLVVGDAASTCTNSGGQESAPETIAAGGWWAGELCRYGWTSWWSMTARANRSMTIEVTAQDEHGFATTAKALPVIGVWRATDALGTQPTVAAQSGALNGISAGLTSLHMNTVPAGGLRIAITDQRGDGRPDFNFGARVLYADAVTPANVPLAGGVVTITGSGFRGGNLVKVNGVAATVQSWSASSIVATVPPLGSLTSGSLQGLVTSVEVSDRLTGGTTLMTRALTYGTPQAEVMTLVSGPIGTLATGSVAGTPFAVRVMQADGVTPAAGEAVVFSAIVSAPHGQVIAHSVGVYAVRFGACGLGTCTVMTDASGLATTTVTPMVAGAIVLSAVGSATSQTGGFKAEDTTNGMTLVSAPSGSVTTGSVAGAAFAVRVLKADGVTPVVGTEIVFSAGSGSSARFGACGLTTCTVMTDATGLASTTVTPMAAGTILLSAVGSAGNEAAAFAAVDAPNVMSLVSAPSGNVTTGAVAGAAFTVRVMKADGVTPVAGAAVIFSASGAVVRFGVCGQAMCTAMTNSTGLASTTVTPLAAGAVSLLATGSAGSVAASFTAADAPNVMTLVSGPTGTVYVGSVTAAMFAVKVVKADGVTAVAGLGIVFSTGSGSVRFGACGLGSCTLTTDAGGMAATTVTPLAAGAIVLSAVGAAGSEAAGFTAVNPPNGMSLVSSPAGTVYLGDVAANPFAVRVVQADGVTPVAGVAVVFSSNGAAARLGACGLAICTVMTDATGLAATMVAPLAAGAISLSAVGSAGSAGGSFVAAVRVRTVTAMQAVQYVAAGTTVEWRPQVALGDNSGPVAGVVVSWIGSSQMTAGAASSNASSVGLAWSTMTVGPLAAGVQAAGSGCAWGGTVCAAFVAQGVDASALQVGVMSGAAQTVSASGTLAPVVLQVTDGAGHPVAGAVVQAYQTVEPGVACPVHGRCPAVAVRQQGQSVAVTDVDGLVSIAPLQENGVAEVTHMVMTSGRQGSISLTLTKGW